MSEAKSKSLVLNFFISLTEPTTHLLNSDLVAGLMNQKPNKISQAFGLNSSPLFPFKKASSVKFRSPAVAIRDFQTPVNTPSFKEQLNYCVDIRASRTCAAIFTQPTSQPVYDGPTKKR